ncbi:MAG TPA: ankyrin repeat domain-containing protein [Terriglobia bacterium]|nr:ankyrin repeat domain-containing protein [Terriglobia bacterium]
MFRRYVAPALLWACAIGEGFSGQVPAKVDFGRDVLPVFRQNCIECHGPARQMNGMRLDRRSSVFMKGRRRVVPGSIENSFLYYRLTGTRFGMQMPPSGPLSAEQIATIKAWIDQGAEWPDALANEADLPPLNPQAVSLVEALHAGDLKTFMKFVAEDPTLLNARGPEGSTPFMYAVLYLDAATLEQLLKKGADPNLRNDAKATALMWAATSIEKTRVLLAHGADVNARSDDARTPLMIAAGHPGGTAIVKLLLNHGANPNPTENPLTENSPLIQAALAAAPESMQMLIDRGANVKDAGGPALAMAITTDCRKCVNLLVAKNLDKSAYTFALLGSASLSGDVDTIRLLLDHGANVNAVDRLGRTALMHAVVSDVMPLDGVKLLIERGADINAKSQHVQSGDSGQTVLEIARLRGETPLVNLLEKSGATGAPRLVPVLSVQHTNTIQNAIQRSLPLLQRSDANFASKSGCISCHNNSLAAMTVGLARKNRFGVDESIAAQQVKANVAYLEDHRETLHQGFFAGQSSGAEAFGDTFGASVLSYILVGLDAEHYKPDLNTDAVTMYLKSRQMPDGHWAYPAGDARPPLCSDYIGQTALAMRALQLYAPGVERAEYEESVRLAAAWLVKTEPRTNEDRVWRLLGLAWAAKDKGATQQALRELLALQRSDGGWSDLPATESNAYETGRALVALHTAGLPVSDPAYERGVQFLLNTQVEDGSWHVKTRALGLQPYFENGFPHGVDQFISAAGTGWATMALTLASQAPPAGSTSIARIARLH